MIFLLVRYGLLYLTTATIEWYSSRPSTQKTCSRRPNLWTPPRRTQDQRPKTTKIPLLLFIKPSYTDSRIFYAWVTEPSARTISCSHIFSKVLEHTRIFSPGIISPLQASRRFYRGHSTPKTRTAKGLFTYPSATNSHFPFLPVITKDPSSGQWPFGVSQFHWLTHTLRTKQ
jgi:hypothetical protein